jgi:hypothetical protein
VRSERRKFSLPLSCKHAAPHPGGHREIVEQVIDFVPQPTEHR